MLPDEPPFSLLHPPGEKRSVSCGFGPSHGLLSFQGNKVAAKTDVAAWSASKSRAIQPGQPLPGVLIKYFNISLLSLQ
jgi:hypothetical protein